jgi:hypothetical protein
MGERAANFELVQLGELFKRALRRSLVGPPSQKGGAMTKSITRDVVVADFDNQFWLQRRPFATALGTPTTRAPRLLACKPFTTSQLFKPFRQARFLGIAESRSKPDVS